MENHNLNGMFVAAGAFEDDEGGSGETRWERNVGLSVASQQTALTRWGQKTFGPNFGKNEDRF